MIRPSCDEKTRAWSHQKNTFGLLPGLPKDGGTCPGATCGAGGCLECNPKRPTCYVYRNMIRPNVRRVLAYNTQLLRRATRAEMVRLLDLEFTRFEAEEDWRSRHGHAYRLHWSGDVFSRDYALALHDAMRKHPRIQFWGYTRSFDLLPFLTPIGNLRLYVSLDPQNVAEGAKWWRQFRHRGLSVALMFRRREDIPKGFGKVIACPVDIGKLKRTGACMKCRACLKGRNIWFKSR